MKKCFTFGGPNPYREDGSFVELRQSKRGRKLFTVIYGASKETRLTYAQAAQKLGEALMHYAACESKLDNTGD